MLNYAGGVLMKVALIQQKYYGSKASTLEATVQQIKEASNSGALLVILQELHQTEYFCQCEDTKFFEYANSFKDDILFW